MQPFTDEFIALALLCSGIVVPITELIKKMFNWTGWYSVLVSFILSVLVGGVIGIANHLSGFVLIVLMGLTWAIANGWYKVAHQKK
jgi:uncharacterized membrane protein HdeD (DUF308 family)